MPTDYDAVFGEIVFGDDGDVAAIQTAIDSGHDINCVDNSDRWNLLHCVLTPIMWQPNVDVIRVLLENGAAVNQSDREQWTPLHFAARTGCVETLRLLLAAGANPNVPDDKGVTPFHRYFLQGSIDPQVVRLFVRHGGRPTEVHIGFATACDFPEKSDVLPILEAVTPQ